MTGVEPSPIAHATKQDPGVQDGKMGLHNVLATPSPAHVI